MLFQQIGMTLSTLKGSRGGLLVEAAPLVPDRTICNPINDFKLGGVVLIDSSLSFLVSGMLNPRQQKDSEKRFDPGQINSEEKIGCHQWWRTNYSSTSKPQRHQCPALCTKIILSAQDRCPNM